VGGWGREGTGEGTGKGTGETGGGDSVYVCVVRVREHVSCGRCTYTWLCLLITPPPLSLARALSLSLSIVRLCVIRIGLPRLLLSFLCAKRAVCEWCALIALWVGCGDADCWVL
jgi:hypothetical protein